MFEKLNFTIVLGSYSAGTKRRNFLQWLLRLPLATLCVLYIYVNDVFYKRKITWTNFDRNKMWWYLTGVTQLMRWVSSRKGDARNEKVFLSSHQHPVSVETFVDCFSFFTVVKKQKRGRRCSQNEADWDPSLCNFTVPRVCSSESVLFTFWTEPLSEKEKTWPLWEAPLRTQTAAEQDAETAPQT